MAPTDYAKLEAALTDSLKLLRLLRITPSRVQPTEGGVHFVGGYGDVQQATLSGYDPPPQVALKKLRPYGDRNQRLRVAVALVREITVWSRLKHPNIIMLVGFHIDEVNLDTAWLITWWKPDGNLLRHLNETKPNEWQRLKLALDTARGLTYLHECNPGVCHGDIKPENVLINRDGSAQLCDFGVSRVLGATSEGLTTTASPKYTLRYAAPELLDDDGTHTFASDVWAWGCLLLVIVTDQIPYAARTGEFNLIRAITSRDPPADLTTIKIGREIERLLEKCWERDPEKRVTMRECARRLRQDNSWIIRNGDDTPFNSSPSWAIFNPLSLTSYDHEVVSNYGHIEVRHSWKLTSDGSSIYVFDDTKGLSKYKPSTGKEKEWKADSSLPQWSDGINSYAWSSDAKLLALLWGRKPQILVVDAKTRSPKLGPISAIPGCKAITIGFKDRYLIGAGKDTLQVIDLTTGISTTISDSHPLSRGCEGIEVSPYHLITVVFPSDCNDAYIYDVEAARRGPTLIDTTAVAFTPDEKSFVTGGSVERGLRVWNISTTLSDDSQPLSGSLPKGVQRNDLIETISISSSGQIAVTSLRDGNTIVFWELETARPLMKFGDHEATILRTPVFDKSSSAVEGSILYSKWIDYEGREDHKPPFIQRVTYRLRQ